MSISNANPSVATFTRYRYVAVGAETSISGADANGNVMSYSPGREQVYLNGTMLVRAQDYTATTGSSLTGITALVENDVVEVLAFTSFAVAAGVAQDEAPSSPAEGQLWLDTNGTVPGVQITRWSKAPSTGATSLSGNDDNSLPLAYTAGYETVYRNGVLLSRGNDYTATDGTSITLIDATLAGDIIEVFGPSAIGFADTYTQSQANSTFIAKSLTTTTGDIIYASAANTPARLGIGSTDQVLKVSGGIPAWGAAATTSLVKIAQTSFSTVASQAFDNCFSATYKHYIITLDAMFGSTSSADLLYQARTSAPATITTNYYGGTLKLTYNSSTPTNIQHNAVSAVTITEDVGDSANPSGGILFISINGSAGTSVSGFYTNGNSAITNSPNVATFGSVGTAGFLLSVSTGTMTGRATVYGMAE